MLRCKDLPYLTSLQRLSYLTGKSGWERVIRWIYTAESIDFSRWIRGGELLFISEPVSQQRDFDMMRLVRMAIRLNMAGVVFLSGEGYFSDISVEAIRYAKEHDFALMTIPWDVPLVDITEEIGRAILMPGESRQMNLVQAVLFGGFSYADKGTFLQNASYPFGSPQCLAIIGFQQVPLAQGARRDAPAEAERTCDDWFQAQHVPFSTLVRYEQLILLFPGKGTQAQSLLAGFYEELKQKAGIFPFHIGAAQAEDALFLEKTYQTAQVALQIARQRNLEYPYFFNPCGLSEFILTLPESKGSKHVLAFAHRVLLPLEVYDKKNKSLLIETLGVYLQENGNLLHTASRLFIHRNTLKYRLHRIEEICDCSLEDAEVRFVLYFALTVRQYI